MDRPDGGKVVEDVAGGGWDGIGGAIEDRRAGRGWDGAGGVIEKWAA